jgi:hypothetical protein
VRRDEVADRVAAELVPREPRELQRDGGLGDDGERLDGRDVAALDERLGRLARRQVDRAERLHQSRQGLHRAADDDLLAVRAAALGAAGVVGLAVEAARVVAEELVVRLRPAQMRERETLADLDRLDSLDRHQGPRKARVEPLLAGRVGTEARRRTRHTHLGDAAERVAIPARRVDRLGVGSVLGHRETAHLDADRAQQLLGDRARGDEDGRVPRARPLERVADIVVVVLHDAGEVGVAGPRQRHRLCPLPVRLALGRPGAHPPRPVPVVAVADDERERRAERAPLPQPGEHLDLVGLDRLARAAAVALLAAAQVGVDLPALQLEPGRQARQDRDERRPVRLAGG